MKTQLSMRSPDLRVGNTARSFADVLDSYSAAAVQPSTTAGQAVPTARLAIPGICGRLCARAESKSPTSLFSLSLTCTITSIRPPTSMSTTTESSITTTAPSIPTITLTVAPSPMLSVVKSTSYHLPTSCLDNIYTLAPDGFDTLQSAKVTGGLDPACFPVGPLPDPNMTTIYFPVPCHTGYEAVRAAVLPSSGITVNTCCPS